MTFIGATINKNSATASGGGVCVCSGTAVFKDNSYIVENVAYGYDVDVSWLYPDADGHGLFIYTNSYVNMQGLYMFNKIINEGFGLYMCRNGHGQVLITNTTIEDDIKIYSTNNCIYGSTNISGSLYIGLYDNAYCFLDKPTVKKGKVIEVARWTSNNNQLIKVKFCDGVNEGHLFATYTSTNEEYNSNGVYAQDFFSYETNISKIISKNTIGIYIPTSLRG